MDETPGRSRLTAEEGAKGPVSVASHPGGNEAKAGVARWLGNR